MARSYEIRFNIGGNVARSFSNTFTRATSSLTGLQNQTRQTQRQLNQLGNDFRRGRISEDQYREATERLTHQLERLEAAQKRIKSMKSAFSTGIDKVKHVAGMTAMATAAAGVAIAYNSLNKAADFEQQITKAGVIAGASAEDMKRLSESALELGAKSSLSASQVAVAMTELGAKGMDTNKIIGAMPGIIAAAESSGEDLALTSDVVTSALNAFNLKASAANHIADVMAMSANATAAGVADLGYSFKYAAPVANTLGISLEELAAATGIMVDKGLSGEQAGTSLRMALIRLSKPPKEAKKALDKLGISVVDKNKKFKSITEISDDWNKATKKLTQTQKVQYAAAVFGTEAATGMLNLFAAGPKKIGGMTKALEESAGSAEKAAKAMKDNYGGSLEQLKGSIESAQIKFATPILPVFKDVFDSLGSDIDGNMGKIENAGKRVAAALTDIFEPITMKNPVELSAAMKQNPEMVDAYQSQLAKFNKYNGMDFGDKVVQMLDTAADKIEKWLGGPGGKSMNKIFTKLGELAAKAWWEAFSGSVKSAASNLSDGNYAAAGGMGVLSWMLGGGLAVKGLWNIGKWGWGKFKGPGTPGPTTPTTPNASTGSSVTRATGEVAAETGAKGFFKKTLGPIGTFLTYYELDKAETNFGDWLFGHEKGQLKNDGLFNNPFDLTPEYYKDNRQGAFQKFFGIGDNKNSAASQLPSPQISKSYGKFDIPNGNKAVEKSNPSVNNNVYQEISSNIKTSSDSVKSNLDTLSTTVGQANGWLSSLSGIQTAGERVIKALNDLESRINSIKLPNRRVSYE